METQFVTHDLLPVMLLDGHLTSHPIVQPVEHPNQIAEIFDSISYSKGAAVIRMLEEFLGRDKFRSGVSSFLKKFAFKNAVTHDLWTSLELESGNELLNISYIMDTWTRQMGYPIVRITGNPSNTTSLTLTQERFFHNRETEVKSEDSPYGYKWEIPLHISTSKGPGLENLTWFHQSETKKQIHIESDVEWVNFDTGRFGYYRVLYPKEMLIGIKGSFHRAFVPEERAGFLDDLFALAFSNYIEYDLALDFGLLAVNESHVAPWDALRDHLKLIGRLLRSSAPEELKLFEKYISKLTSVQYGKLSWTDNETEPHLQRTLKSIIFYLACENGHSGCLNNASQIFKDWLNSETFEIPPVLRSLVYKWGIWQTTEVEWNTVWDRYLRESDPQERVRLIGALSATQKPELVKKLIDLAKNESLVRQQDYFTLMRYLSLNPIGNTILWDSYRLNYPELLARFTLDNRYFGRMISFITADFSTSEQLKEMEDFLAKYPMGGAGERARKTALENVKSNIQWSNRSIPSIVQWLKSQNF